MAVNFNLDQLATNLQNLQKQVNDFNKFQQQAQAPVNTSTTGDTPVSQSTYPKSYRSDTVEDILNNPEWKQQLGNEFATSESGAKAKQYTDILFMEFCEKQTGRTSTVLTEMRKKNQEQEKANALPRATKSNTTKTEDSSTPVG